MKTLGVDLSAQDAGTAACVLDWNGDRPRLDALRVGVSDTEIREHHLSVEK